MKEKLRNHGKNYFLGLEITISNSYVINNILEPLSKKGNENFKRTLLGELNDKINIDDIKLEKENYIPNKYIYLMHGTVIIKEEHKEYIYCRKNRKRKIINDICNECKINLYPECHLPYYKNYVYFKIIK